MRDLEDFIASAQFDVERDSVSGVIHAETLREWFASWQAAQAQTSKPVAAVHGWFHGECVIRPLDPESVLPAGMALYSQPQAQAVNQQLLEALKQILGWRELRSGANEVPIGRIEDLARAAIAAAQEQK